jgi:hypothetical protein
MKTEMHKYNLHLHWGTLPLWRRDIHMLLQKLTRWFLIYTARLLGAYVVVETDDLLLEGKCDD